MWYYFLGAIGNAKTKAQFLLSNCTIWFWWLMQLDIMQDRKMPSKMWKGYLGSLEKSFFQQRIKNITYIWSLGMFKFLHIERLEVVVRDQFEQKWELGVYFVWMTINNLVWLMMSFTLFTWSQEEACQQRHASPVFLSPWSGVKGEARTTPLLPPPTSYNSPSLGALNPLKLTSLCTSLALLLVVTPRAPRFSGHSSFLTFFSPKLLYSLTVLWCW